MPKNQEMISFMNDTLAQLSKQLEKAQELYRKEPSPRNQRVLQSLYAAEQAITMGLCIAQGAPGEKDARAAKDKLTLYRNAAFTFNA